MDELRLARFRLRMFVAAGVAFAASQATPVARATSSSSEGSSSGSESTTSATDSGEDDDTRGIEDSSCAGGTCGGGCGCYGRPYISEGVARHAILGAGGGWSRPLASEVGDLTLEEREALVAFWTDAALAEHSSIAGFHRFALDLLAHGAPVELVIAAGRAANQEVEHARACFALASRYAGREIGAGPMPIGPSTHVATSLAELATWTVHEGCVGETIAAWLAAELLEAVEDVEVRAIMATIAAEEAEHAELAWATTRWAIATGGKEVADAVAAAFATAPRAAAPSTTVLCAAHGLLPRPKIEAVMRRAAEHIVEPCARALLSVS